jgi:hypothetical protein
MYATYMGVSSPESASVQSGAPRVTLSAIWRVQGSTPAC